MRKLVVLTLDGDLEAGVRATLEIGCEGEPPSAEISGQLPPNPDILTAIDEWRSQYRTIKQFSRIKAKKISYDDSIIKGRLATHNLASELRSLLNDWLLSESFRPIREKFLKHLMPSDEVRVLIRTASVQLEKLPWHLWDLVDREYPNAEITLSLPESEQVAVSQSSIVGDKIKILAILGDSEGIDVRQDRRLLKKLPLAATTFLVKPKRQDINDKLWNQHWDILFFAGHSKTEGDNGRIYINDTDSLTIAELRYALRNAVNRGLKLAIFNSCDGLGLARELQDLLIPQTIVMREPVPDLVAQTFLRHFLVAFSTKQSLYAAFRYARERLQGLEGEFPGASWLPVIYSHPHVAPMTWLNSRNFTFYSYRIVILLLGSVLTTASVLGVRHLGILQKWELFSYDQLLRIRPEEEQDSRLLIVTINEEDEKLLEQKQRIGTLSDLVLEELFKKLTPLQPRVIGLDINRDFPVEPNQTSLATRLRTNQNLFAICKVSDSTTNHPGTSPPPEVPQERLGFSNVIQDWDGVVRRHSIAMNPSSASGCTTPYSFSTRIAFHYLEREGISAESTRDGNLQLGDVVLKRLQPSPVRVLDNSIFSNPLGEKFRTLVSRVEESVRRVYARSHIGSYPQIDTQDYQILLNYRSYRDSPVEIAAKVTLTDVLRGAIKPEQVKDRIILIGTTAQSGDNYLNTPYGRIPAVILQAQMVSQIVSGVKDGRPLLSVWSFWGEVWWIWGWSVVGGILAWCYRSGLDFILAQVGALLVLCATSLIFFHQGSWVPLVPSALVLVITGSVVMICLGARD